METAISTLDGIKLDRVIKDRPTLKTLRQLALQLRREQLYGASDVANATAKALRTVVSTARFTSLDQLIFIIRTAGRFLQNAQPNEQTIGNITRRVLHLLREEARAADLDIPIATTEPQTAISTRDLPSLSANGSTTPTTANHSRNPSYASTGQNRATSSSNSTTTSNSQFLDPSLSFTPTTPGSPSSRPTLSAFKPGSTFSISDLVAAGASSSSAAASSFAASPIGSGANTPGWGNASLDRLGYGVEKLHLHSKDQKEKNEEEEEGEDDEEDSEEDADEESDNEEESNAHSGQQKGHKTNKSKAGIYQLKPLLIQAIQELIDELETVNSNIAKDARDHVHSGEVIFTLGYSHTVEIFLKTAAKDRKFTVIVGECAPSFNGHKLAKALSSANISTLLVPDNATFTLMPRITKILLGAHCILANGGLLASAGTRMVAEAARAHATPTVVLAGVYKVCPDWQWVGIATSLVDHRSGSGLTNSNITAASVTSNPNNATMDTNGFTTSIGISSEGSPLDVIPLNEAEDVEVVNPIWDYVDPDMIDLLITNVGEHPVSLVYRLLSENYNAADLEL